MLLLIHNRNTDQLFLIDLLQRILLHFLDFLRLFRSEELVDSVLPIYILFCVPRSNPSESAKEKGVSAPVEMVRLRTGSLR